MLLYLVVTILSIQQHVVDALYHIKPLPLSLSRYSEDKHSLLKSSHLVVDGDSTHQSESSPSSVVLQATCPVCLAGADECQMMSCSLGCRHSFCSVCWLEYISDKINTGVAAGEREIHYLAQCHIQS